MEVVFDSTIRRRGAQRARFRRPAHSNTIHKLIRSQPKTCPLRRIALDLLRESASPYYAEMMHGKLKIGADFIRHSSCPTFDERLAF